MNVVICTSSSFISESEQVFSGQLYMADSLVVRQNPGLFDADLEKYAHGYEPPVENVEVDEVKRGPGRPRKETYV